MTEQADPVITDILRKIERERNIAIGANNLRKETNNTNVIQRCNIQIRVAQKNIEYLEDTLKKMTLRQKEKQQMEQSGEDVNSDKDEQVAMPIHKPTFTVLDLLKYECPSLGHKIQYMLQLLQFKMQVEDKYREANEKIYKLYKADGDRKSLALADEQRLDSDMRLQLIKKSMKQYQSLYVDVDEISRENAVINTYHKNPLTGTLLLTITAIRNVDHISSPMLQRNPECTIVVKIDDTTRVKTKPVRTDRWNENFTLEVMQANELSFIINDEQDGQQIPVALCWLPLSDIAEEIRRKKVQQIEGGQKDTWISASSLQMHPSNGLNPASDFNDVANGGAFGASGRASGRLSTSSSSSKMSNLSAQEKERVQDPTFSCWFELEPAGQILVTLGFVKGEMTNASRMGKAFNGLGRHGAIRQRKEKVTEYHGHKFVQKQFYNIMCCAVCGDFLRYTGFQCQDCRFLCHKKCYKNVITKCISKPSLGSKTSSIDDDEMTLKHRIPHHWVQVTNRGTKWCCHCGYILPWGKKNVRKCAECGQMCHTSCAHLVPDFCGMSMEKANQILQAIKMAKERKALNDARRLMLQGQQEEKEKQIEQARQIEEHQRQIREQEEEEEKRRENIEQRRRESRKQEELMYEQKEEQTGEQQNTRASSESYPELAQITDAYPEVAITQKSPEQPLRQQPEEEGKRYSQRRVSEPANDSSKRVTSLTTKSRHHHHRHHHRHRHGLDDFKFLAVLGKGNFGKVMLAESIHTGQLCAIKVLKKDFIIQNDEVESTRAEKRVFLVANKGRNPFLIKLHQCFQTENRIYFVMEYIPGGDLMWHVQQRRFSQKRAQFYAAEVLLALKYLHENGVIYRDLKLDNILLTSSGHIKLADYGLCKENMWLGNKTSTFCGTPELMAPEILKEQGYGKAVDWWAFGVLLYQMLLTKSPFRGEDEDEVFNSILTDEPLYPINMAKEAVDILQRLLTRDPEQRLGSGARDAEDIMDHPYFANIDWDAIMRCEVTPPYIPDIKDPRNVACFDEEFTSQAAKLTPVNSVLTPTMQEQFRGFTYASEETSIS